MAKFFPLSKTGGFFLHLTIILVIVGTVIFFTLRWLSTYTNHGEYVVVPDFRGQRLTSLDKFVEGKQVSYQIIDSIYDPHQKAGVVLWQDPLMNSKVKHNRTIYLYVTGMVPPQVVMPKLIDRSERQARLIISSYGLKVGKVEPKRADCNGCVLEQLLRGRNIEPGAGVKKGSVIDLVIGQTDGPLNAESDSTNVEE